MPFSLIQPSFSGGEIAPSYMVVLILRSIQLHCASAITLLFVNMVALRIDQAHDLLLKQSIKIRSLALFLSNSAPYKPMR
ncbi:hypothetical protein BN1805_00538 [Proteus vulgaris]|nr:hypothetical protein BN1805_00538 [Proteus vulgaris]